MRRRRSRFALTASASLTIALLTFSLAISGSAAVLGASEFVGEFGRTGQPMTCGSVWGLIETDDLNGATCQGDLRARLTTVAWLVGIAGMSALAVPAIVRGGPPSWSRRRRVALAAGLAATILVPTLMVAVGRHLIWSVAGA